MSRQNVKTVAMNALKNGTMERLMKKVESCDYKCEAGFLQLNIHWQTLKALASMGARGEKGAKEE